MYFNYTKIKECENIGCNSKGNINGSTRGRALQNDSRFSIIEARKFNGKTILVVDWEGGNYGKR